MLLKGGLALELRMDGARTTADIDLRMTMRPDRALTVLGEACSQDLGDFLRFQIAPHPRSPRITGDGIPYEGLRFRVGCTLAERPFVHPFGLDIGFGDPIVGEIEVFTTPDTLAFAGIPSPRVRLYPVETHLAEKLHAYTLPRPRMNSRVKDLPDIALLASSRDLSSSVLRRAIDTTFAFRASHPVPFRFEDPPSPWTKPYRAMAESDGLPWTNLPVLTEAVRAFLDPVLASSTPATWDRHSWRWSPVA